MPSNDPVQNAPHLRPRLGVPAPDRLGSAAGQHEHSVVLQLERHIGDGDDGAVRRFVHELEHELGPFRVSPWRLLEHLAERAIGRRSAERSPEAAPESPAQASTPPLAQ